MSTPFIRSLRDGYGDLEAHDVTDALIAWQPALEDYFSGLTRGFTHVNEWLEDYLSVCRWLPHDDPFTPELQGNLQRLAEITTHPEPLAIQLACTCAHLLRTRGEVSASDAAFTMIKASFPDSAAPTHSWVDSMLDAAEPITSSLLDTCAQLLEVALTNQYPDQERSALEWQLQAVRADQHQSQLLDGFVGSRWPYFEVFAWPTPIHLHQLDPTLEDNFAFRWAEFFPGDE